VEESARGESKRGAGTSVAMGRHKGRVVLARFGTLKRDYSLIRDGKGQGRLRETIWGKTARRKENRGGGKDHQKTQAKGVDSHLFINVT